MRTMDSRYDTYGFAATRLEEVAPLVQQILGLQLEERDSGYYAGTYYLHEQSYGRELKLYRNHDHVRGSWVREQYRDYAVILEVSDLDNMDEIRQRLMNGLEGAVLLSSKVLPAEPSDTGESR
jgi:hypothetical protein